MIVAIIEALKKRLEKVVPLSTLINFFHLSSIQVSNAVLQILLYPFMIRIIGLAEFGYVMVINSVAMLACNLVNYGTNQSAIKNIAANKSDTVNMSEEMSSAITVRLILFFIYLLILPLLQLCGIPHIHYYLFASSIIFAEVLNPIFFYIGIEKLLLFNIANLVSKVATIVLLLVYIKNESNAYLINFFIGITSIAAYLFLHLYARLKFHIYFKVPKWSTLWLLIKTNFYLVTNNISVHLQQSFFLFTLSATGNATVLGAYALCDKLIMAFRLFIISFASALYPKGSILFEESPAKWIQFKHKSDRLLLILFILSGLFFIVFPSFIVKLFTGVNNQLSIEYVRVIAFVPLIISLNSLNIIELLIRNDYKIIFRMSFIIAAISITVSFFLYKLNRENLFPFYPFLIEGSGLILCIYYLKKYRTPSI